MSCIAATVVSTGCLLDQEVERLEQSDVATSEAELTIDQDGNQYVGLYEKRAQGLLAQHARDRAAFHSILGDVYGASYDYAVGEQVRTKIVDGDFSWMPIVQIVDQSVMPGAAAAYSTQDNRVYLSANVTETPVRALLYLEECGHYLDTVLGSEDTAGDEGEEFMRRLIGLPAANRTESDHGTIVVDGQTISVEFGFWGDLWDTIEDAGHWIGDKVVDGGEALWDGAEWTYDQLGDAVNAASGAISDAWDWVSDSTTWACLANTFAAAGTCGACSLAVGAEAPSGGTATPLVMGACSACTVALGSAVAECLRGGATTENGGVFGTSACTNPSEAGCVGSSIAQISDVTIKDQNVHQDYKVSLYDGTGHNGNWQAVGFGNWYARHIQLVGNDRISSVAVPPGTHVSVFQHRRGVGDSSEFFYGKHETARLDQTATQLNNQISSVEVRPAITVFEGTNFDGAKWTFAEGNHYRSQWSHGGGLVQDNAVSSYIVGPGVKAKLCDGAGGTGYCETVEGDTRGRLPYNIDNRTSYIEVTDGVTIYDKAWYKGAKKTLTPGTYNAYQLGIGNDRLSSLVAAPGIKVTVCSDRPGIGDCSTFRDAVWYVGDLLNNRASTLIVEPDVGVKVAEAGGIGGFTSMLGLGSYGANELGIANDSLTSLVSTHGIKTTVYSDRPGIGDHGSFYGYVGNVGSVLNNRASTVVAQRVYHATIYDGEDFTGAMKNLGLGSYSASQLGIGNDRLSSLEAGPGIKVTVCQHSPGVGECRVYRGRTAYVGGDMTNRASTVIVEQE